MRLALLIICLSISTQAGPHPWHYIKTHKELLASDVLIGITFSALYGASRHCQNVGHQYCQEVDGILPTHPSGLQEGALVFGGYATSMIAANHLIWHYAPEKNGRHIFWMIDVPVLIGAGIQTGADARSAERIQACYHDGLCK